jgi:indolepyruvate ferredoxin oxidoreductase
MFMLGYAWQKGWVPLAEASVLKAIELNGVSVTFNTQAFAWGRVAAHDLAAVEKLARASAPAQVIEFKRAPALDDVIARRVAFLTAYQNAAYADRYRKLVDQIRTAEGHAAPHSRTLTTAVAKSLFKLMACKDEYEVARLHMETGFQERLRQEFEGDFTVNYHLAPPILSSGKDARGRPLKRQFGQWIEHAFRILARLKFLRGTPLDVFGYSSERRMERGLIDWYEKLVLDLVPWISPDTIERLTGIAAAAMDIRGYGPVKLAAVAKVRKETEELVHLLKSSITQSRAA